MTGPDSGARQAFAAAGALLDTGRSLNALSRALTVLALAATLVPLVVPVRPFSLCAMALSAAAGLAALYFGARVAFDAALFHALAAGRGDLAGLDQALAQLRLVPAAAERARPAADRFAGARRLLARQALLLCVQAAGLLAAGWAA